MKKFATDLAGFLRRYYPEACRDGSYRFSADIEIRNGLVEVEIPILTRMPDASASSREKKSKREFGMVRLEDGPG